MAGPPIVLYTYPESPFGQKLELMLLLKQLPFSQVLVPNQTPRPQLELLGVKYRKNPVMAIGNDVFFDSYLASIALDRAFPQTKLLTPHEGVQRSLSFFWSDRAIFSLIPVLMDWDKLPEKFLKDRATVGDGSPIVPAHMLAARPSRLSALRSNFDLIEAQLAGRTSSSHFLLDTAKPTFLDISVYVIMKWCRLLPGSPSLFKSPSAKHPLIIEWMSLMKTHIDSLKSTATFVTQEQAASTILSTPPTPLPSFKTEDHEPLFVEGLALGDLVEVTPNDYGKVPQRGILVAITSEVVVVEVDAQEKGKKCRALAPRLGFTVKKVRESKI